MLSSKLFGFLIVGLVLLLHTHLSYGEIHRARVRKPRINNPERYEGFGGVSMQEETADSGDMFMGHSKSTWFYSILSAVLVGLSGIFPLIVIPLETGEALSSGAPSARLKLMLSFAVGGLLGDVFLHLLPEAFRHIDIGNHDEMNKIGGWIITGILAFLVIEKIFPEREEEVEEMMNNGVKRDDHYVQKNSSSALKSHGDSVHLRKHQSKMHTSVDSEDESNKNTKNITARTASSISRTRNFSESHSTHIKTSGWLNLTANVIDNFTHGLAVAGSYCISNKCGVLTTAIVLLHEVPHEIGDFAILLRSGFDRWKAAKAQLLTASGGVLGALTALFAESTELAGKKTAWVLPFTSGGFIYVALVSVVPDLLKETDPWESLKQVVCLVGGIACMAIISTYIDDHDFPSIPEASSL